MGPLVTAVDVTTWLLLGLLFGLLMLSAFFSGSETAFTGVDPVAVRRLQRRRERGVLPIGGRHRLRALEDLQDDADQTLATLLVGNNVANVAMGSVSTLLGAALFGSTGVAVVVLVLTIVLFLFGEVAPKMVATRHSLGMSLRIARPLVLMRDVMAVVVVPLLGVSGWALRRVGLWDAEQRSVERRDLVRAMQRHAGGDVELLEGVFEFHAEDLRGVLVPRVHVEMLPEATTVAEARAALQRDLHTRYPVYRDQRDQVIGILHTMDLHGLEPESSIVDVLRPALKVPASMKVSDLLERMRQHRAHMVIVLDEWGGVEGICTIEDLVEELVGEILDEHDADEQAHVLPWPRRQRTEPNVARSWRVRADAPLEDVARALRTTGDWRDQLDEFETVGGLFSHLHMERHHRLPTKGARVLWRRHVIELLEADGTQWLLLGIHRLKAGSVRDDRLTAT